MLARHLESAGDAAGALDALKRAQALDPKSPEILAEIAGHYARQNKGPEAIEAAERALALNASTIEAHRILGLVYAAWSDGGVQPPAGKTVPQIRELAIQHLSKIAETSGILPGRKSLAEKAPWTEAPYDAFAKQLSQAYPYQYPAGPSPKMGEIETASIQTAVQQVATGAANVNDATKQLCTDIDNILAK